MNLSRFFAALSASFSVLMLACTSDQPGVTESRVQAQEIPYRQASQCVKNSPLLEFGRGAQFPATPSDPMLATSEANQSQGSCSLNRAFRFGAGRADITGPAGGKILMGNENIDNYSIGIHMRLFSRAFVIGSECNQKRVLLILTDTGMIFGSVRQAVLDRIAADPMLQKYYRPDNLMLSATHTHSGPGGYSHYEAYNFFRFGFDQQAFDVIVDGIVKSLKQAHLNYERTGRAGTIDMAQGELLGANASRSPEVYQANPESERRQHLDVKGQEINTNRQMTLLRLNRTDGKQVGSLNWFAVHPTSDNLIGQFGEPISGDNKGFAMYFWERMIKGSSDEPFVSAFLQADSGDVFSYLWHRDQPEQARRYKILQQHSHESERHPLTIANGTAQLAKALELHEAPQQSLFGGVDYRFGYVKMDNATVTDPEVLKTLQHPQSLDSPVKASCNPSLGYSFLAGGRGAAPGEIGKNARMGVSCTNSADKMNGLIRDLQVAMAGKVPTESAAYSVGCQAEKLEALNLQCQAEKPVFLLFGPPVNVSPTVLPFQIIRLGNLAIVGIPWEITTMAGRRIRQTVLQAMRNQGVTHVEITGLANDFVNYLTTREEYAVQGYEGASNQFGPWTLAVVQQELRRIALSFNSGSLLDPGPIPPTKAPTLRQVAPFNVSDLPTPGTEFGAVVTDVKSSYAPGNTAIAVFRTANPNNDLMTEDTFLWVDKLMPDGNWQVIATDGDPETTFLWKTQQPRPQFLPSPVSDAEIIWRIPANAEPGIYRLRHQGATLQPGQSKPIRFQGVSKSFEVKGTVGACAH